ncbi:UNVERIFIED_CONTAM: hypothetical protein PYX00_004493 [Menopon gallinae]|uniref:Elongation of very long chain fatty acids protein n=1 Tax=Menopon gallinae TaxID=328185 RepID=A0AAW2I6K9_9NEOP
MNVANQYATHFWKNYVYYEDRLNTFLKIYLGETDPRTSQWPFTRSPIPLLFIFVLYYIMYTFGPRLMSTRKALEIRKVLIIYNIIQICLSFFVMKEVLISAYQSGFSLSCQPLDLSMNPVALRMAASSWWYHISKYVDLFDTIFFVLRKKQKQLSFLHLFHHSTMLFNSYLGMLYIPGGQAVVSTFLNSFVHVIMYCYYFLSSLGPQFAYFLWWKKYLTILQLIQFFSVLAHVFWGSFSGCEVPRWLKLYVIGYVSVLILLFLNFYMSCYNKKSLVKCFRNMCIPDCRVKVMEDKLKSKYSEPRKDGKKSKSPFTVVGRVPNEPFTDADAGDLIQDKDKDL